MGAKRSRPRALGLVLPGRPTAGYEMLGSDSRGLGLQVGTHRVVPAVEVTEVGNDGNDLHDVRVAEKLPKTVEIFCFSGVWDGRRFGRKGERRTFLIREDRIASKAYSRSSFPCSTSPPGLVALEAVCAMQYLQPAALLAT